MKKQFFYISFFLLFSFEAFPQQVKVVTGASSIDIVCFSNEEVTLYYSLYTSKQDGITSVGRVKDPATDQLIRNGKVTYSFDDKHNRIVHTLAGLSDNKTYYLYTAYDLSGRNAAAEFKCVLPERQPTYTYISRTPIIENTKVEYLLYKPESYLKDTTKRKFPLILNVHGYLGGTDANAIKSSGIAQYIDRQGEVDFIMAAPRNLWWPGNWYAPGALEEFMNIIKNNERIDLNKVYVTGLSGGSPGAYFYAATFPDQVAAILGVCSVNPFWNVDPYWKFGSNYCVIKDIPLWNLHNQGDDVVGFNNSVEVVKQISACSPKGIVEPRLTLYQANGHDAWTATFRTKAVYNWLLGYTKATPTNRAPVITNDTVLTITVADKNIEIKAEASDPDNSGSLSYEWVLLSAGDLSVKFPFNETVRISDYVSGTYKIRLLVTDNLGARTFKDIQLTIKLPEIYTDLLRDTKDTSVGQAFPNPVTDKLNLRKLAGGPVAYKVISLKGEVLLEGKSDTVDFSSLSKGVYTVETETGVFKVCKD